jgi:hypothetical protein
MRRTVFVYLMGGLGNVLFQINYAYRLYDAGYRVVLASGLLERAFATRIVGWSHHGTVDDIRALGLLDDFEVVPGTFSSHVRGWLSMRTGRVCMGAMFTGHVAPSPGSVSWRHVFGYFHLENPPCERFLRKLRAGIDRYTFGSQGVAVRRSLADASSSVVCHVRGGDYRAQSSLLLNGQYYEKALREHERVIVVSNDRAYARDVFDSLGKSWTFSAGKSSLDDFCIIAKAHRKVIANSTFSWWAAEAGGGGGLVLQREPFFEHLTWRPRTTIERKVIQV